MFIVNYMLSDARHDETELEQNTFVEDQLVTIETSEEHEQLSESSNKDKKLFRCLHCDMTDSNAYLLLLHQIKSHPGNKNNMLSSRSTQTL